MTVYQIITERIVKLLAAGVIPWLKPWDTTQGPPRNFVTKKYYRGINVFLLSNQPFKSPYWMSFLQISGLGGSVKAGAKATPVIFWKLLNRGDAPLGLNADGDEQVGLNTIPLLRYYSVFNVEQTNGISVPEEEIRNFNPIQDCEQIISAMPNRPAIQHDGDKAYYHPKNDFVNMPAPESFIAPEDYYSAIYHELTHSTGHESRLSRPGIVDLQPLGAKSYSKEELVAEMGAAFLCATAGIENKTIDNSAAYIASWLKRLEDDNKLVVHAAAQAQRAADYILGHTPSNKQ